MVWLVSSVNGQPLKGLEGTYRGVEADASLGLGGGARCSSAEAATALPFSRYHGR